MTTATPPARVGFVRRHKVGTALLACLVALLLVLGGWVVYLNHSLSVVPRVQVGIVEPQSGDAASHPKGPVNILIAGTDSPQPGFVVKMIKDGWQPGSVRSDTIMLLHITADRNHAYLVSIPRDTWTSIPGYGHAKINAAFSYGGPRLCIKVIQQFTGLHIDHLVMVGWDAFEEISTALGGVDVYVPQTTYDSISHLTWTKGWHHIQGVMALHYVRQRHGLLNGDFDRINRQQNFLRAVMSKLLSQGTMTNPLRLTRVVSTVAHHLILDQGFSASDIRKLAFSLRGMRTHNVTFTSIPLERYATIDGQSAVIVNKAAARALFRAVAHDNLPAYLNSHGTATLPPPNEVS